ncbi:MAG: M48 family metalloprotease [Thermodesulfobacteriota bacterium]
MTIPTPAARRPRSLASWILLAAALLAAAPMPASRAWAFSVAEEREVGEQLLAMVRQELALLDDPDLTAYVTRIGRQVLGQAGVQYFDYHFFVVRDKELNAFAAPSGLIFIHSGLIETMDSEDELYGVLAHEIGHVVSRHIAERMEKGTKVGIGTMAAVLAGALLGSGDLAQAVITGALATGSSLNLKFSRQDEEEADRLAFHWLQEIDRDPHGQLDTLRRLRRYQMMSTGKLPPYLLTHPDPEARMGYVQDLLAISSGRTYPKSDPFDFLRFKQRIRVASRDPASLIPHFTKELAAAGEPQAEALARYGLALAQLAAGNAQAAAEGLAAVVAAEPNRPILQADLGVALHEAGRYQEAKEVLTQARDRDPELGYATFHLARALGQLGERPRAIALLEGLIPILPDYSRLYFDLGGLHSAEGHTGVAYYYLGMHSWLTGDPERAVDFYKRALTELDSTDPLYEESKARWKRIQELEMDKQRRRQGGG